MDPLPAEGFVFYQNSQHRPTVSLLVAEMSVNRDPRRVAWGYDFTFRVPLDSLMMGSRSGMWGERRG